MKAKIILLLAIFVFCFASLAISDDSQSNDKSETSAKMAKVFKSEASCKKVLSSKKYKTLPKQKGTIRLATWNIRWFPLGNKPGDKPKPTNIEWLSCVIAWLDVDIIAVQEFLDTKKAKSAWKTLGHELKKKTGGKWKIDLQSCGEDDSQRVGFIWNSSRIKLSNFHDQWLMNGVSASKNDPCANYLRPGRSAYAKALDGGVDFHIVSVHLDSGREKKDYKNRKRAISRIDELYDVLQSIKKDKDVIVGGDFNIMGFEGSGGISSKKEIHHTSKLLKNSSPSFKLVAPDILCSEYYGGKCKLIDHFAISESMASKGEAVNSKARVMGYCAVAKGKKLDKEEMPRAYKQLSDHCPIILDIMNKDMD